MDNSQKVKQNRWSSLALSQIYVFKMYMIKPLIIVNE